MKKFIIAIFAFFLMACSSEHRETHSVSSDWNAPIYQYQVQQNNDWLFYYILFSNNHSCPCYTYSSPTPVYNFNSIRMQETQNLPVEVNTVVSQKATIESEKATDEGKVVGSVKDLPPDEMKQITEQLELPLDNLNEGKIAEQQTESSSDAQSSLSSTPAPVQQDMFEHESQESHESSDTNESSSSSSDSSSSSSSD